MEGQSISTLCTPALVVDLDKVKKNAQRMIERCQKMGVQLRPHMKTHKTLECADIMTGGSRRCIVVSTLAEACFYADHGFDDILYAYCLPFDKVERCALLSERLDLFQVLLDHPDALQQLKKRPLKDGRLWHVWLKIDCGNGRAGVLHSEPEALRLAQAIAGTEGVELTGVYAHCGNTYNCRGVEQIQAVAQETTSLTLQFMEKLKASGIICKSSIGSTPSCSHPVKDMEQLSEVHPGNYVFYEPAVASCVQRPVDVVFMLDGSERMGLENHRRAKEFIENVANQLILANSNTDERSARFALLQYGSPSEQRVEFPLTHNLTVISDALGGVSYMDSSSALGSAIIHAVNNVVMPQRGERLARRNAELAFIFITDGITSSEQLEEGVSAMRRAEGVPTVIAVGSDTDEEVLRKVSLGDMSAIFRGNDYTILNKPSFFERFVRWIC